MVRLIVFEWRKHFFKKSLLLALVLFCIINVVKIGSVYNEKSLLSEHFSPTWRSLYWQQYDNFGGEMTISKINTLMKIYRPLEKQTADLTASNATDNPDTVTGNVYSDYFFYRDLFVRPMEYSYSYENNAKCIVSAASDNINFYASYGNNYEKQKNTAIAKLYNGRNIKKFEYTEMYKYLLQYDFSTLLCIALCLYGLINVFVLEKETEMDMVLLTTKAGGRKTVLAKIIASALFIVAICSLFWLVDFASFVGFFGSLEGIASPIFALQNFEYASVNISLLQYTLLSGAIKTMGMLTLGMSFLAVSCLFKNVLLPFILSLIGVSGLALAAGQFIGSGHIFIKTANPFILLQNHELYRKTEFLNFFGLPIPSYVSALLFALLWIGFFIVAVFALSKINANCKRGGKLHASYITRG